MIKIANIEAEQAVLGGLLFDNDSFDRLGRITANCFYTADHKAIFAAIEALVLDGAAADILTVHEKLQGGGHKDISLEYLHSLMANTPSTANIGYYAAQVTEKARLRGVAVLAAEMQAEAGQAGAKAHIVIEGAQNRLEALADERAEGEPEAIADLLPAWVQLLDDRHQGKVPAAVSTGYPDLDRKLNGGFRGGQLVLIAGRPKMGKTSVALNICTNIARSGIACGFLSMEMGKQELLDRQVATIGKVDLGKILQPQRLTDDDWPRITHGVQAMQEMPLYLDDQGGLRLIDVRQKARALKRKHNIKVLAIDYLQLMDGDGDSRNAQIEQITRGIKSLAKELDITVLLLSQLNRNLEQRPNKRPLPADLRDSGAIEQDCDIALFVYRDEIYNPDTPDKGICEVIIGLHRQGATGTVGLAYIGEQVRFESLAAGTVYGQAQPKGKGYYYSGLQD